MHTVTLTVGLFALTLLVPGPNMLFVIRSSLAAGRAAGVAAGLGVATGDAIYAALGLGGMVATISQDGQVFRCVKIVGCAFLLWTAWTLARRPAEAFAPASADAVTPQARYFFQGLATDLANPQTILFFASIFAATLTAETPTSTRGLCWFSILVTSVVWRACLAFGFATSSTRRFYERKRPVMAALAGGLMAVFALRLLADALGPWNR
jgi:amino acid exporter